MSRKLESHAIPEALLIKEGVGHRNEVRCADCDVRGALEGKGQHFELDRNLAEPTRFIGKLQLGCVVPRSRIRGNRKGQPQQLRQSPASDPAAFRDDHSRVQSPPKGLRRRIEQLIQGPLRQRRRPLAYGAEPVAHTPGPGRKRQARDPGVDFTKIAMRPEGDRSRDDFSLRGADSDGRVAVDSVAYRSD